ncbi:class I SAM-dependent methyltransferase [Yunchengibacter salinarum]|uniref:class I SAM-dependent methyltransferase n=1 Tax=Yunchengibacter salinarum TaxID=3133399 RepID=UPI0035B5BDCA
MHKRVSTTVRAALVGVLVGGAFTSAATALDQHGESPSPALKAAIADNPHRKDGDSDRDQYRHPLETLAFFGIDSDDTVAEVNPGGGWYSRILAPLLKEDGQYIGLEHNPELYKDWDRYYKSLKAYPDKVAAEKGAMYGENAVATFIPADEGLPVAAGSVDVVTVVRAMHNWLRRDFMDQGLEQVHGILKDGGTLGVVQHRAPKDFEGDPIVWARKGRWNQDMLVARIEAAGFELVESSEINANPKDEKNYPSGVWTLPPTLALGDENRDSYLAVGESDRMTLKFRKVAQD